MRMETVQLMLGVVVDSAPRRVRRLYWRGGVVLVGVAGLGGHGAGQLGVKTRERGHHLGGQAGGRDEGLGHAHRHGDDVSQ